MINNYDVTSILTELSDVGLLGQGEEGSWMHDIYA